MIHLSNDEYFGHYGTKGMKWGIRKKYYSSRVKKGKEYAKEARKEGKRIGDEYDKDAAKATKRATKISKEGKEFRKGAEETAQYFEKRAASAQKKLTALGPKPVGGSSVSPATKARIKRGSAVTRDIVGTLATAAVVGYATYHFLEGRGL
jgi:hypothetical protein